MEFHLRLTNSRADIDEETLAKCIRLMQDYLEAGGGRRKIRDLREGVRLILAQKGRERTGDAREL